MSDEKQYKPGDCSLSVGRGCRFCKNKDDEQVEARACESCYKLHVTDWLKEYPDNFPSDIVEVRFKNTRRSYYQNVNNLPLEEGDIVAVEASPGHDVGIVSLTGDMVSRQMRRQGFNPLNGEFKKVYRKAKPYDIEKWQEAIALEHETMIRSRQIAAEMKLNMKIGDVEYQGDKIKAIFYYIADERVDFRELIKVFAEQFHIRVEMKQIGARQEAGRIGGLGSCGRQLCCASWISSFASVTTNAARTQDLSLNPQKLAGQCSKLKCCLIYELDDYIDARREFPRVSQPLQTLDGDYFFVKNDILARTMSFSTAPGSFVGLVTLPIARVREIMRLNADGKKPEKITSQQVYVPKEEPTFVNVIGEESITRFDSAKKNKKRKQKKGGGQQSAGQPREGQNAGVQNDEGQRNRPEGQPRRQGDNNNRGRNGERRGNDNRKGGENRQQNDNQQSGQNGNQHHNENRQQRNQNGENRQGRNGSGRNNRNRNNRGGDRSGGGNGSANGSNGGATNNANGGSDSADRK